MEVIWLMNNKLIDRTKIINVVVVVVVVIIIIQFDPPGVDLPLRICMDHHVSHIYS